MSNNKYVVFLVGGLSNTNFSFNDSLNLCLDKLKKQGCKATIIVNNHVFEDIGSVPELKLRDSDKTFYDTITSTLKHIRSSEDEEALVHIVDNTEDLIDSVNKNKINKFLHNTKCKIFFHTTKCTNQLKALDFGTVPKVYSRTSAGLSKMSSDIMKTTLTFLAEEI